MAEVAPNEDFPKVMKVAKFALVAGLAITLAKFGIFFTTNSVAVLSDAFESIINVVAAAIMVYTVWFSQRPADRTHKYGHGKIEFMAVGLEGWLILIAGLAIFVESIRRWVVGAELMNLDWGLWLLGGVGILSAALAIYVWWSGRKYDSAILVADGKHLMTDVASTVGVFLGLLLVRWTEMLWLDSAVAMVVAAIILFTSWRLLWQSFHGLMDSSDPEDEKRIKQILEAEKQNGAIASYHKLRHRRSGPFRWVDMHLQVDGAMTVREGHTLATRIERRIEEALGRANATAHLEPIERDEDHPDASGTDARPTPPELQDPDRAESSEEPPDDRRIPVEGEDATPPDSETVSPPADEALEPEAKGDQPIDRPGGEPGEDEPGPRTA